MNGGGLPRVRPVCISAWVNAASDVIGRKHRQRAHSFWSELLPRHSVRLIVNDCFELFQEASCDKRRDVLVRDLHGDYAGGAGKDDWDLDLAQDFGLASDSSSLRDLLVYPLNAQPELLKVFVESLELWQPDKGYLGSWV